jgi:outer membrane receptor for ferrienterochelin and colicin
MKRLFSKLLPLAAILLLPAFAQAQETDSAIRGRVIDPEGSPVAGASVVVTDTRSGISRPFQTNSTGTFLATSLAPGGPYIVSVDGTDQRRISSLALGDTLNLTINLRADMEEIIAVGQAQEIVETSVGPAATFGLQDLDSAVAFARDIKDVYTIDPRLNLEADGFQVNCAGKHPRFNSITLDGVSHNDRFGLNSNGYSTATGMPFPYDAIQMVSVELAPFDTNYGGFSACNVNAVTKRGENEFQANAFYEYTTESLINDELDGQDLSSEDYTREKLGFSIGGPIIQDRLHFFAAYEETEEPRFLAAGYDGSGNGEERPWFSQDDYQTIVDAAATNFAGYDTGGQPGNGAQETENYLVRLDWQITDRHALTGIYNYYDGFQTRSSDSDPNEFEFANHFYVKGSESKTTTIWLDSQWTDAFSSQIYYTDTRMNDSQVTVGPPELGDHQISIGRNTVYLGADDSRQANRLFTDASLLKLSGKWLAGDHVFSVGYEREELEVFNIFVQHSRGGEWDYFDDSSGNDPACAALTPQERFDDILALGCELSGIDKFVLGRPDRVYYGSGGGTNNPIDAAANFTNVKNSLYVQDEIYFPTSDFTLVAGLRFDWIRSDDSPNFNENLSNAIGVRNDTGLDGLSVLMPRVGFNWGVTDDLTLRGGVGLFSGGNPNVWLSNAWSRDGVTNVQVRGNYFGSAQVIDPNAPDYLPLIPGTPGGQIPQELFDDVAAAGPENGSTFFNNLIDPNYEQPREWKYALGGTWEMPWGGISADFDYMYTELKKGAIYRDVSQEIVGQTIVGAPIYQAVPGRGEGNLMLTNTGRTSRAHVVSAVFQKSWDWGLDALLGYAWTDATDVSPMTSFTASSSFDNLATNDINFPGPGPSNYVVRNRVTLRLSYAQELFGDNLTRFTLMGYYNEGQPNTYTMDSDDVLQTGRSRRHLLYVPDGPNDPNVVYTSNFPVTEFLDWARKRDLKGGQFVSRNSVDSHSSSRIDLRVDQEIPLGMPELKARAFVKIYNFTNLLNDDWGWQYDSNFFSRDVVDVDGLTATGQYIYDDFSPQQISDLQTFRSLWEIRLGLDINFN